jgi:hypothetical protein
MIFFEIRRIENIIEIEVKSSVKPQSGKIFLSYLRYLHVNIICYYNISMPSALEPDYFISRFNVKTKNP